LKDFGNKLININRWKKVLIFIVILTSILGYNFNSDILNLLQLIIS